MEGAAQTSRNTSIGKIMKGKRNIGVGGNINPSLSILKSTKQQQFSQQIHYPLVIVRQSWQCH